MTDFCLRCHRSASSGQGVPLAQVTFPIVDPVRYPFFTGWDKTGFGDSAHSETDAAAAPRGGCALCHQPHGSDNPSTLLRPEDTTASAGMCLTCHGGSGGAPDIGVALAKASHHPVLERTGIHKDLEGPTELGYNGGTPDMRHAECQDCHDSHLAGPGRRQPGSPLAGPALNGIGGVTAERWPDSPMGSPLVGDYRAIKIQAGLSEEWQVCFKCHSRYTSLPETDSAGRPTRDIAAEFNPHNASFHPVVVPSRGTTVNGFVEGGPWQPGSRMACTDCHSNDDTSPAAAVGPHGSANPGILRRPFDAKTGTPGTDGDLCFLCHDRGVYGGGDDPGADATRSAFSDGQRDLHDIGLPGQGHRVACVACHSTIVHGGTRPALLVSVDDTAPYRSDGAPGVTLTAGMPSPGGWTPDSCSHEGACHR